MTFPLSSAAQVATERLLNDYRRLLADASYAREGWSPFLDETSNDISPRLLLGLLQQAGRNSHPKANRQRSARLVQRAFHHILDALGAYREDMTVSPRFRPDIEKELVRRMKALSRTREQDFLAQFERFAVERSLGDDLIRELLTTARATDEKDDANEGDAVPIIHKIRDASYGSLPITECVGGRTLALVCRC